MKKIKDKEDTEDIEDIKCYSKEIEKGREYGRK